MPKQSKTADIFRENVSLRLTHMKISLAELCRRELGHDGMSDKTIGAQIREARTTV